MKQTLYFEEEDIKQMIQAHVAKMGLKVISCLQSVAECKGDFTVGYSVGVESVPKSSSGGGSLGHQIDSVENDFRQMPDDYNEVH